jgi:hypothetical protein
MGAGLLLPKKAGSALPGRMSLDRRPDGPGPSGLVRSLASLAVLLLGVRALMVFLEVRPNAGPIGQLAAFAYTVTSPLVWPVEIFVPWIRFAGRPVDLPALVLIAIVLLVASMLIRGMAKGRPRGRR